MTDTYHTSPILHISNLKTWFPIKRGIWAKTVGYVRAVDGVTLSIDAGETLGLVGESGCGKTTLGRTILRLEKAREGRIEFKGKDLLSLSHSEMRSIRREIQIIFQDPISSLNPRMSVMDIVTEGLEEFHLIEENQIFHAKKLMNEVGLDAEAIYRYPHEFSGGQKQRINIARALSLKPSFIVCDEPVSALDVSVQAQVVNLLMDLREAYGLSYLFISHDLSIVSNIAKRIAVMYLGKIVELGTTDDIVHHPKHPYTKALISAVPVPGVNNGKKIVLEGSTPSPSSPPAGCRFHPRCREAMKVCAAEPPLKSRFDTQEVWCHLYGVQK